MRTESAQAQMEDVIMNKTRFVENVMKKLKAIQTKIKHKTLGKTKVRNTKKPNGRDIPFLWVFDQLNPRKYKPL